MWKKIFIGIVVLVVLVIGTLVAIPFFYSIDNLRPQIQSAAEQKVRGKVLLGPLSLKLFPTIKVHVEGVTLTPPAPYASEPLAQIQGLDLSMPLSSLLAAPRAAIVLVQPNIKLVSRGPESSNLSAFLPAPAPVEQKPAANQATSQAVGETLKALPGWLSSRLQKARLSFQIQNGEVQTVDQTKPKTDLTRLSALNLNLENIGLSAPMVIDLKTQLDFVSGTIKANGPMHTSGQVTFTPVDRSNEIKLNLEQDLSGLDLQMKPLFHKPAGTAVTAEVQGLVKQSLETTSVDLSHLGLRFANVKAGGTVKLTDATDPVKSKVAAAFKVDNFDLAPFGSLVPLVREYKLAGKVSLDLKAEGPVADPTVRVDTVLSKVSGATPQLQKPISDLNGHILVTGTSKNPAVKIEPFSLRIGSSDLAVSLSTQGLDFITVNMKVASKLFNADELLGLQPIKVGEGTTTASGKGATPPPAMPLDESLNQLAPTVEEALKNPFLDKAKATINVDFKQIKALGAEYRDAVLQVSYDKRHLRVPKAGLLAYGGKMVVDLNLDLNNAKAMGYAMNASLNGVRLGEVTALHAPKWSDTLTGALNGDFKVAGLGLRKEQLAKNLNGGLKGEIRDGKLSLPVLKLVGSVISALPAVAGKKLEAPLSKQEVRGNFKTCKIDSEIKGRMIQLKDLDVVYDAVGTKVGDLRFKASGSVSFDRMVDITGTAFASPDVVRVAELKGPSGLVEIPLHVTGDMSDPKPDYAYSTKILGERVAKSLLKSKVMPAAQEAAKKELGKQIDKIQAPAPVKDQLNKLKKKFGF